MNKIAALTVATALAVLSFGAGAAPMTTYVFTSGGDAPQPLAAVRDGVFAPVEGNEDNPSQPQLRYRFGANGKAERVSLRGMKLFGYRDGNLRGTWTVRGLSVAPMDGAAMLDIPDYNTKTAGLLASTPLRSAGPAPAATRADVQAARTLVQTLVAKRKLPRESWPAMQKELEVKAVRVVADAAPVLVISGAGTLPRPRPKPDQESEYNFGYLIIAEKSGGRWAPAFEKTFSGDEGCAPMSWHYHDHADLDGDGTDELIIDSTIFESNAPGTILRRSANGRWQTTAAGKLPDGSGCG